MKISRLSLVITLFLGIIFYIFYNNYKEINEYVLKKFVHFISLNISNEIKSKQKSTLALAITISHYDQLKRFLDNNASIPYWIKSLPEKFSKYSNYKNIEIEIVNRQNEVLFNSKNSKKKIEKIDLKGNCFSNIVVDEGRLKIVSAAQLFNRGYLFLFSRFNSIRINLEHLNVDTNFVLNPLIVDSKIVVFDYSKRLDDKLIRDILDSNKTFVLKERILYSKYPLKNLDGKVLGYVIFFTSKSSIMNRYINSYIYIRIMIIFTLIAFFLFFIYFIYTKEEQKLQKQSAQFFYKIFENLQEIVIVTDGKNLKYANKKFFEYFNKYKSIDDFSKMHECVCELFENDEEFLQAFKDGKSWIEYVLSHEDETFRVKVKFDSNVYIFKVKGNKIAPGEFSVIFTDITDEYLSKEKFQNLAYKDSLTGLYNRYLLEKIVKEKIEDASISNQDVFFVLIDVDHFKQINDIYGHDVGDKVLKKIANILKKHFRATDPIFRLGGEEFFVVLVSKSLDRVLESLEELKKNIASTKFEAIDRKVTISIGVTVYNYGESIEDAIKRADRALYISKKEGRDKITFLRSEDDKQ